MLDVEGNADHTVLVGAVTLAFFFLLRGGEYLCHDGGDFDRNKALRGADITFWKDGKTVKWGRDAPEVSIRLRSSKADIFNAGASRNHFRSGSKLCAVEALARIQERFPERFGDGEEAMLPLFRLSDGSPVLRSMVQDLIQQAAVAVGLPPARYATHSLRIGGACALLHAGMSVELIQRWGRWASQAFQAYLWESPEDARGVAAKMIQSPSSLSVTRNLRGG